MAQETFLDPPMPDIIDQWRFYFSVLQPQAGDQIIDIGCNTGEAERFLLQSYPDIGQVTGIEKNPKRYQAAYDRWQQDGAPSQIAFALADGRDLPFAKAHFERALCVETLEWIPEPLRALREIGRVLKPGGIAVIIHSDFDTQVFNTSATASAKKLGRKIVHTFADAGPNGQIGRELYGLCRAAGFQQVQPSIYPLINTAWAPNLYAYKVAHMMVDWLARQALVTPNELDMWLSDLMAQAEAGRFFYSINRYICCCSNYTDWCFVK